MYDNQTIAFLFQPGLVAAFVALLVNWRINREVPGVGWWPVGMGLQTLGTIIRTQNALFEGPISLLLVNMMLAGGQFVMLLGLCRFTGRPMFGRAAAVTLALLAFGIAYYSGPDDIVARTCLYVAALAVALVLQVSLLRPIARREGVSAVIVLGTICVVVLLLFITRCVLLITMGPRMFGTVQLGQNLSLTGRQAIVSLVATVIATTFAFGYILLVASRNHWQVQQLAIVDALTGAPNRRAFDAEFRQAASRARRSGARLGLALTDLDHFKRVNDTHGHAAGDALLCHFTRVVREVLRETDFFARIGGEEFALLLTDASGESVTQAAERIRIAFETDPLVRGETTVRATVSIGAAVSGPGGADPERLYAAADAALYRAKAGGRNRVECQKQPVEAPLGFAAVGAA